MRMIARGIAQLARRPDVWGDHECTRMLRATHNSDEVRHPEPMRKSLRDSGRRLVRGSPLVPESVDSWPGVGAGGRLEVKSPGGAPRSDPGESTQNVVVLLPDLSAHVRAKMWPKSSYLPPASALARLNGGADSSAAFALRALGLPQDTVRELSGAAGASSWWDVCSTRGTEGRGARCLSRLPR